MARSLLHQMVLKYFVYSSLDEEYQLNIIYHKDYIEMRSPLWDKHLTLCFSKYRDYWCINMPLKKRAKLLILCLILIVPLLIVKKVIIASYVKIKNILIL